MTTPAQAYGHPNFVDDVPIQGPTDEGMRRLACCYAKGLPQASPCVDCGDGPVPGWTRRTLSPTRVNFYGIGDVMGDRLGTNSQLLRGQSITSPNGAVSLVLKHDGDLVLRSNVDHRVLWHTGTAGRHVHDLWMNWDGNLRLTDRAGNVIWDNGAHGHKDAHARVQDDGQLFVWDGSHHQIWDAGASLARPNPIPGGSGAAHTDFGGFNPFNARLNFAFRAGVQPSFQPPPPSAPAYYPPPPPPPSPAYSSPPPPPPPAYYPSPPPPPPPSYTTVTPVYSQPAYSQPYAPQPDYPERWHRHHEREHHHRRFDEQPAQAVSPYYQPEYQAQARAPQPFIHSRVTGHSAMENRAYPIHHGRLHGTDALALAGCGGGPCWSTMNGLEGPSDPAIDAKFATDQLAWVQNTLLTLNDKIMSTSGSSCPTWADPTQHMAAAVGCFQTWWNTHYAAPSGGAAKTLRTDGTLDEDTLCALLTIVGMHPEDFPTPFPDPKKQFCQPPSALATVAKVHKGIVNYLESLSMPAKVGIGVAAGVAVGGVVYAVARRKTSKGRRR